MYLTHSYIGRVTSLVLITWEEIVGFSFSCLLDKIVTY